MQPALIRQLERQIEDLREDRDAWREQARRFMLLVEGPARRTWWQRLTGGRREPMVDVQAVYADWLRAAAQRKDRLQNPAGHWIDFCKRRAKELR